MKKSGASREYRVLTRSLEWPGVRVCVVAKFPTRDSELKTLVGVVSVDLHQTHPNGVTDQAGHVMNVEALH